MIQPFDLMPYTCIFIVVVFGGSRFFDSLIFCARSMYGNSPRYILRVVGLYNLRPFIELSMVRCLGYWVDYGFADGV